MSVIDTFVTWLKKQWKILQLQNQIRKMTKQLNKIYRELGKDYVDTHKYDPDDLNHDLIAQAVSLQKAIAEKNASIDEMRGIVRCVACGERIPRDSVFCPYCGMRQPEPEVKVVRYCPSCGTKLEVDEVFCHHCGRRIPQDDAPTEEISLRAKVQEEENPVSVKDEETIVVPASVQKAKQKKAASEETKPAEKKAEQEEGKEKEAEK